MEPNTTFKILTAYEDLTAANRARQLSEQLAAELRPGLDLDGEVWKFELLRHPRLRKYAVADAVASDLVILSTHGTGDLPAHVKAWLKSWVAQKRNGPRALVALLEQEEGAPDGSSDCGAWLRRAARQGNLDFFCKTGNWREEDFEYVIDIVRQRTANCSAVLEEILHQELRSRFECIGRRGLAGLRAGNRAGWRDVCASPLLSLSLAI